MSAIRALLVLAAAATIAAACTKSVDLPWPGSSAPTPCAVPLWSAGFETGDVSEWTAGGGGSENPFGTSSATVVTGTAHSGTRSFAATISAPPVSGVLLDRIAEATSSDDLFYSAWLKLPPAAAKTNVYWVISAWHEIGGTGLELFDVVLQPDVGSSGSFLRGYGNGQVFDAPFDVPQGSWFHLEALYRCRRDASPTGQVTVWQDDTLAFQTSALVTGTSGRPCGWILANSSDGLSPSPARVYFDDASISANCGAP